MKLWLTWHLQQSPPPSQDGFLAGFQPAVTSWLLGPHTVPSSPHLPHDYCFPLLCHIGEWKARALLLPSAPDRSLGEELGKIKVRDAKHSGACTSLGTTRGLQFHLEWQDHGKFSGQLLTTACAGSEHVLSWRLQPLGISIYCASGLMEFRLCYPQIWHLDVLNIFKLKEILKTAEAGRSL